MKVLLAVLLMGLIAATSASDFYVGWSQSPSESYSQWAQRRRFLVHDKLVFKYKKGEDSVLVVKKTAYDSCSTSNPIKKMDGGDSVFDMDRPGPFYFISGVDGKCAKGQKLAVVVLAERNKKPTPPTPTSPSPSSSPPVPSPSPSPSPSVKPPITSPSSAAPPSTKPPITGPSPAPSPSTEPPTSSPSPYAPPPPHSPTAPPSLSPLNSVPPSTLPPGSQVSPAPSPTSGKDGSSASAVTASSLSLGLLLVLLCAAMA